MSVIPSTLSLGANLPIGWDYYGCWSDYGRRKLAGPSYVDTVNMTQESCVAFCNDQNHPFAGVEYGQECYCGLVIGAGSESKADVECDFKCPGAAEEACGSNNRLSVLYTGLLDYTRTNPGPPSTSRIGCLTDSVYARTLSVFQASEDGMTVSQCTSSCNSAGYSIAGLEYGRECFCGDALENNATIVDEGCDMRCSGDTTEFCGGYARLDAYTLNMPTAPESTNTSSAVRVCNPTTLTSPYILNGGFEEGLANWTAVAYNASSSNFDIGLTNDTLEGCTALTAVPKPDSRSLSQHFQVSTDIVNLQPSYNYTLNLSIGHRGNVEGQNAILDPKYTVRLSDALLGYGAICGFAYSPCPLVGLNNSAYMTLSMPFQADDPNETLTVYLSWYNGNFDVSLYLDSVVVQPQTAPQSLDPESTIPSLTAETSLVTVTSRAGTDLGGAWNATLSSSISAATSFPSPSPPGCQGPAPKLTRWADPPPELTNKSVVNNGFENGLEDWTFDPKGGSFDISITNQSIEGCFSASIHPTSPHNGSARTLTLQTRLTNLNSSNEWYAVELYVGHADLHTTNASLSANATSPRITMSYQSPISSDIQRTVPLCGFATSLLPLPAAQRPCSLFGARGSQWQVYGMDVRLFHGSDGVFTNETWIGVMLEIDWPAGAAEVPIFVDAVRVWEIEWGTISR